MYSCTRNVLLKSEEASLDSWLAWPGAFVGASTLATVHGLTAHRLGARNLAFGPRRGDMSGRGPDRAARGRIGEQAAASFLVAQGYEVLAMNQRTPAGEIDLVCKAGSQVVVVEVKARSSAAYGEALEAIGPGKARRLRAAAAWWLAERGLLPCRLRFDAVVVMLDRRGCLCSLHHHTDVIEGWF